MRSYVVRWRLVSTLRNFIWRKCKFAGQMRVIANVTPGEYKGAFRCGGRLLPVSFPDARDALDVSLTSPLGAWR